jgi:hypothetical protein
MIKTFCDYCGEQCFTEHYVMSYKNSLDDYFAPVDTKETCHDCFWKIQSFIKTLIKPQEMPTFEQQISTASAPPPDKVEKQKWWKTVFGDSAQLDWEDKHGKR